MGHAPLLRLCRKIHAVVRAGARQQQEPAVLWHQLESSRRAKPASTRLDRRRFLAVAGAAVAATAAGCSTPPAPNKKGGTKGVAVVGAGMAGLHCAHRLREIGVDDVRVFEAQDRLGGRMLSDRTVFAPLVCELGGELIDTGHETMRALAEEFGLTLHDFENDDPDLDTIVAFFGGRRVPVEELLTAYAPIAARIDADLATIGGDGYVTFDAPNGGEALDGLSIRAWFDRLVTDGVIAADNIARQVFELAFNIEYGLETDEQSVLNMLFLTSTDTTDLALFGDSDERFHTAEGNDAFIQALAGRVGDLVELEHRLTALSRDDDGRLRLRFSTPAGDVETTADEVVLTLPFTILREVEIDDSVQLSPAKRLAIDTLGYGTNAKLMVGFRERFWRNKQDGNTSNGETYSDTGYQASWETSRLQTASDDGILTNFTGGDRGVAVGAGAPAERAADFLAELEQVFPGIRATHNDKVARFHWPTNVFVKGSYACYRPGQYTTITGAEALAEADGHLHFAGEHTSLDYQGYMEGAALSGAVAALAVADNLGFDGQALLADGPRAVVLARADVVRRQRRLRRRRYADVPRD
jgi:monoamine oxidase